ncbi:MAG: tRNA (adenosine(37)-N6)-dimethylallyltransferase MiaA [Betaproteobacteria bacterium]|nr:tRNA (adenosine(37)-N6)-dimethylallyltransferase MiaA [Betaproteobacteria bacterium]
MGPTASGKSAVALELAQHLPVEIVSVDSAQVFRDMDVGTAKPSREERAAVPHHLIDIIDPSERYSAAQFCGDAMRLLHAIDSRGRIPLLTGGTMLYFKALREGLSALPQADPALRAAIEAAARSRGWPALHAELAATDPATAARLKPNDSQRIQRALEVLHLTGKPMSSLIARRRSEAQAFRFVQIALLPGERSLLHRRIEARFEAMLRAGLIEEVESLKSRYALEASLPSMRCVGYRQVWELLDGKMDRAELRDRGVFATRQLAKRQLTWLRSTEDLTEVDCFAENPARQIREVIERQLDSND